MLQAVAVCLRASGDQSGAFAGPDFHVATDLREGACVDQRANVSRRFEATPQAHVACAIDETADQIVGNRFVHDQPAARGAALAGGPERGPQDAVGGEVEIRVGHDRDGVLAAQLERDARQASRGLDRDRAARVAVAGEADDVDVRVLDERHARPRRPSR